MKHFAFAIILLAITTQAHAQEAIRSLRVPCYEGKAFIKMLGDRYREVLTATGLTKSGDLIQTYVSPENTFTMMRIMPSGLMCMISSGENWQAEKPSVAGDKL